MYEIGYLEIKKNKEYEKIIEKVITKCYEKEKINNTKLIISIILTNPQKIKEMNSEYRNINKETDVLSFPMFEKEELEEGIRQDGFQQEEVLGDIIVSIDRVIEQAKEYNHSFERELSYMIVHGFYHLMGYDHMVEEDKLIMREKEDCILNELNITRN